jgi:hypothetical protein
MDIEKIDDCINHPEYKKWTIKWEQINTHLDGDDQNFDE